MLAALYVPGWLYLTWPWLCLAMALGYFATGMPVTTTILTTYAGWIFWRRSRVMEHIRRAHWQHQRRERTNHGI